MHKDIAVSKHSSIGTVELDLNIHAFLTTGTM